jgi:transcriptional regulator with XRE-family HTH domain
MSFRSWREKKLLSQERVAEMSGLSLRTVQRLEAGHRVSYASIRALATAFGVDVDLLERELYATNRQEEDFIEVPRWARLLSDRLYFGGDLPGRRAHLVIELLSVSLSVFGFVVSFAIERDAVKDAVRVATFVSLLFAFLISIQNRTFDRYGLWAGSENAPPKRSRTWQGVVVEYAVVLGVGLLGVGVVALLVTYGEP